MSGQEGLVDRSVPDQDGFSVADKHGSQQDNVLHRCSYTSNDGGQDVPTSPQMRNVSSPDYRERALGPHDALLREHIGGFNTEYASR